MAPGNFTRVTEFILTGVSERPDLQIPLFFHCPALILTFQKQLFLYLQLQIWFSP
ncbi:hypothetical protein HPG69_017532 [Diceros bicornis minor]|uniref:Uncharacterized protein n=1 Tax=Diceros bicornis minor TaxID=77932 RepID=A0A7J7FHS8_DICBM|nr:hypothetical protein HPG69_017532 [Diceros bicornis minor]